jgi:Flp pilus assembly protein TadD
MVLVHLKRENDALPYFRKVAELDPKSPGAHLNLGIALADQLDLKGALSEFSAAVRLDPNSVPAHYNKGRALLDLQRSDESKTELEMATRLDPRSAESFYLLGMLAKRSGNTAESIQQFQKAVALNPKNAEASDMLGQQLLHEGDTAGAITQWRKVIQLQPTNGEALYNLARLLSKSNPDEAKGLEDRLEALKAEQHVMDRAQLLGNFGLASASAHDWPQAVSKLRDALQICGNCSALPQLHKDLGLIYCHSGDYTSGRAELVLAQKLSPGDADVAKALQLLDKAQQQ